MCLRVEDPSILYPRSPVLDMIRRILVLYSRSYVSITPQVKAMISCAKSPSHLQLRQPHIFHHLRKNKTLLRIRLPTAIFSIHILGGAETRIRATVAVDSFERRPRPLCILRILGGVVGVVPRLQHLRA